MINMLRNWIKNLFNLYDIDDLAIGGHCGCCGRWVSDCIVAEPWQITVCSKCEEEAQKTR